MPSFSHQSLLLWTARKMAADGFMLIGCDGPMPQGGHWNALASPPELRGVRPDVFGYQPSTGKFSFGEAKTLGDIDTPHTVQQLRVFGRLRQRGSAAMCVLYVTVPRSGTFLLDRALLAAGLVGASHIVRLHIPDCFLREARNECA